MAPDAAISSAAAGECAGYASPHLLQVRRRKPGRVATSRTPRSRRPTTTSRRASRHFNRNGRGPVGLGAGLGRVVLRHRDQGLHGEGQLPSEALPARSDGGLRCAMSPSPPTVTALRQRDSGGRPRLDRQPGHRHLRGCGSGREARRHQLRARQRLEPRPAAPDHHRPGSEEADRPWPAIIPTSSSGATAAGETSRGLASRSSTQEISGGTDGARRSRLNLRLPEPDTGRVSATTSATPAT